MCHLCLQMRRSSVVGPKGESVIDNIRTSYGMFIRRLSDPIIERIERRVSVFTHVPISHQEDIQVRKHALQCYRYAPQCPSMQSPAHDRGCAHIDLACKLL